LARQKKSLATPAVYPFYFTHFSVKSTQKFRIARFVDFSRHHTLLGMLLKIVRHKYGEHKNIIGHR